MEGRRNDQRKDKFSEDFESLRDEIFFDKVGEAIDGNPSNFREALEEAGFTWYDDGHPSEEEEEVAARPENNRQRLLVAYFEGNVELAAAVLDALRVERNSEEVNYPLIRRYFRAANPHLKRLILSGLESDPVNLDLLTDLVFFNEFDRDLSELIGHFIRACELADNPQAFAEIAREFQLGTLQDGYHALAALQGIFEEGSEKRKIIDYLVREMEHSDGKDYEF